MARLYTAREIGLNEYQKKTLGVIYRRMGLKYRYVRPPNGRYKMIALTLEQIESVIEYLETFHLKHTQAGYYYDNLGDGGARESLETLKVFRAKITAGGATPHQNTKE